MLKKKKKASSRVQEASHYVLKQADICSSDPSVLLCWFRLLDPAFDALHHILFAYLTMYRCSVYVLCATEHRLGTRTTTNGGGWFSLHSRMGRQFMPVLTLVSQRLTFRRRWLWAKSGNRTQNFRAGSRCSTTEPRHSLEKKKKEKKNLKRISCSAKILLNSCNMGWQNRTSRFKYVSCATSWWS